MTEKQAKKIFRKYNPADEVVRCPNGRAKMRKPLDTYMRAAVNLYGIISRDEITEIFTSQNEEKTTPYIPEKEEWIKVNHVNCMR